MELFLYHFQNLFYYFLLGMLIIRIIINWIIYVRIDSDIMNPNTPFLWTMIPFSEQEKENIRKTNPEIKDFSKDGGETDKTALLYCVLTFWWPYEYQEERKIKKLKRFANVLNVSFLVLLSIALFFFLHMQGINAKYEYIEKDFFYFFK